MKKITFDELLSMFDTSVHEALAERYQRENVTGMVVFECQDMCSSNLGKRTACIVGPDCTFKSTDECAGKWLNDLPSQRQHAAYYVKKEETNEQ